MQTETINPSPAFQVPKSVADKLRAHNRQLLRELENRNRQDALDRFLTESCKELAIEEAVIKALRRKLFKLQVISTVLATATALGLWAVMRHWAV